ncbi:energy-coupling factor ABC transporter ATP-binding protein [Thermopetrobacter sp. TC1]|uniref:energy-coupling factor ABC transporter ATP-binding protein n=1 Tax=Thermopetrobacter sp. TC1 TaxID=1495045 RepID=UPI0009DD38DF|nr:phosphate ABC transporter ATP-binding protein [Thermopetrobacter sp. TC1]
MAGRIVRFPFPRSTQAEDAARPAHAERRGFRHGRKVGSPALAGRDRNVILPLRVEHVSYIVNGRKLLDDLTFVIRPRRRLVVLGYNGAGKSLLLRLCHGLIAPSSGRLIWEGPLGHDPQAVRQAQAMVFQKPVLLRRSVRDNLSFVLKNRGIKGADLKIRVQRALQRCRLDHLADRPARTLSGGEQQRLALARAWILKPSVLFLDEPTSALDPASTWDVERIINDLHEATTTVVFSTHDLAQAKRLADDVLFIHHGRIIEQGPAETFFCCPQTDEARAFLAGELLP